MPNENEIKIGDKMDDNRIISPNLKGNNEENLENSLRPQVLDDYIGQTKVKENMKIYIEAAKKEVSLLIMFYYMDLRGLEKQHWRELYLMR